MGIYKSCLSSPIFIQEQISFQCQHLVMSSTGNTNPGNFANRPREEVQEIASKGGQSRGAGTLAALMKRPERLQPLATQIPAILPTDRRRKSRRLRARAEKPRAAPLSLAVKRRVRLEAREDRLADIGINGPCCMLE